MPRDSTSSSTGRAGEAFEGVEDGLRPRPHLLALAAGQIAEFLTADGVQRPEHHDLALGAALQHGFQARAQRERRLAGARLAAERDDADRLVEQQVQRDPLFGGAAAQPEHLAVAADQLHPLLGVDPAQRVRVAAEQPNAGVAREVTGRLEVDLAVGEQRVDLLGGDLDLVHPGPAGRDDVLGVILVGGQADGAGLDPQRNVLADQRDSLALCGEVGRAGQDPRVVGVGPETGGQHRRIAVVELDMQRTALRPNGNRLIQPSVFEPQIVEHPQGLSREPAKLMVMPLGFQFADDYQRDHDFMLGKPRARPGIGQQHGGVEHIGPNGRIGHVALLEAARVHAAPHELLGGHCGTRTGAGPLVIETIGTARIAEHVASHRQTTLLSSRHARRAGAPWLTVSA